MHGRSGRATDHQWLFQALALHLGSHLAHFLQRRSDQPRQADYIRVDLPRLRNDVLARNHHAEVGDLEIVTAQHDADDVLADVVHVALHRGHHDVAPAGRFISRTALFFLDVRHQHRHGLLHHPRALHHLRQEHLARAKQVSDHVHSVHQWSFDHIQGPVGLLPGLLGVFLDVGVDALDQGMGQALVHRQFAPGFILFLFLRAALELLCDGEQGLGGAGRAVQDHVLDRFAQLRIDLVVGALRLADVGVRGDDVLGRE